MPLPLRPGVQAGQPRAVALHPISDHRRGRAPNLRIRWRKVRSEGRFETSKPLVLDGAKGRGGSRSYKKMVSVGGAFAPNPRLRWRRGRSETCSDNSEPLVLDDAGVAAKAAPTMRPSRTKLMMHPSPGVALGFFQPRSSVDGRSIHQPQDPLPPIPRRKRPPRPGNGSAPAGCVPILSSWPLCRTTARSCPTILGHTPPASGSC